MKQVQSIRFRVSLLLLVVLALVVTLGLFSLWRLADYHRVGDDIRERYLPATQYLGDLNNLTSDFRTAEGTALLAEPQTEGVVNQAQIDRIDRRIAQALRSVEPLYSDPAGAVLYRDFAGKWQAYRDIAREVLAQARTPREAAAIETYMTQSRDAYSAADDALRVLSETNRVAALAASRRAGAAYEEARWLTLGAILIVFVFVLGGLGFIRHSVLTPLLRLADAMRHLAANNMDIEAGDVERRDEIGEMARAVQVFRRNALDLAEQFARERRLTDLQRNFVSMASHEFRTPLTVIDGHAQRLINTSTRTTPAEIAERGGKIRQAVARMSGVIGHLLEGARLTEADAHLMLQSAEFDLAQTLREVAALYRDMAPRIRIVEEIGTDPLWLTGDQKLLFQVFSNMMSNAAKYSPEGGVVRLAAGCADGAVSVTVEDNGLGIPPQDRDRLFERYFRGSNVSGTVGTGIGLYLVKMVVDLHGGAIAVDSREGEGTSFRVILPAASRPPGRS